MHSQSLISVPTAKAASQAELSPKKIGFFSEAGSPVNLAVFRIVVMLALFSQIDIVSIKFCSSLPSDFYTTPVGARFLLHAPIGERAAVFAAVVCQLCCLTGALGIFSRTSLAVAAVSGTFALLMPNCVGRTVLHNVHLLWFACLLAVSRCGDAVSVDALIKRWRSRDSSELQPIAPHLCYALPLRLAWLLFGIIYFFPGLWKLIEGRSNWLWGDGVELAMYSKWAVLGGWIPPIRIDHMPLLYRLGGAATICFELSFIFLILHPRTRMVAAFAGLAFHNLTNVFMGIPFWPLQFCYVAFFNWERLPARITRRLSDFASAARLRAARSWKRAGYQDQPQIQGDSTAHNSNRHPQILRIWIVGIALIGGNCVYGLTKTERAYPLSCYPVFVVPVSCHSVDALGISLKYPSGTEIDLDLDRIWPFFSHNRHRYWRFIWPGLHESKSKEERILKQTWYLIARDHPEYQKASSVMFYQDTVATSPDSHSKNPVRHQFIYELNLQNGK